MAVWSPIIAAALVFIIVELILYRRWKKSPEPEEEYQYIYREIPEESFVSCSKCGLPLKRRP